MINSIDLAFSAALDAVNPAYAVKRHLHLDGNDLMIENRHYNLVDRDIRCIAVGKAAVPMAQAIAKMLENKISQGLVVTKYDHLGSVEFPAGWEIIEAGHPIPDDRSLAAGDRIEQILTNCTDRTLIIAGISGGTSALVTAPKTWQAIDDLLHPSALVPITRDLQQQINDAIHRQGRDLDQIDLHLPIPLAIMQSINQILLASGLSIEQINIVRSQLDRLKGGGLVSQAQSGQFIGLILSDVIGDSIATIASGMTNHPAADNVLVGNNHQACIAVAETFQNLGYNPQIVTTAWAGEARLRGQEIAREIITHPPKTVLIYGGETTVQLGDNPGKGGRNLELALAAAIELGTQTTPAWVATLATDGTDGPTDAAGATVNELTIDRALTLDLDPQLALDRHDSYPFFHHLGDLRLIGATGTNVADLTIAIRPAHK